MTDTLSVRLICPLTQHECYAEVGRVTKSLIILRDGDRFSRRTGRGKIYSGAGMWVIAPEGLEEIERHMQAEAPE